jgi:autotransporter-associated beta strand protein
VRRIAGFNRNCRLKPEIQHEIARKLHFSMTPRALLTIHFLFTFWLTANGAAAATQLFWYGDGVHLGGNGTWNTSSLDWSANGTTFTTWNNASNYGATFDYGARGPGDVLIASAITAGNLSFNDSGFELTGAGSTALTLAGSASIYVASGAQAIISGVTLAGSSGLTLSGGGELVLASSNACSGTTTVSSAFLQLAASNSLPGGNLLIDGGVIELAAGNFTLGVGTAASQVQFTTNGGGFAAIGSNYAVNLGSSSTLTWGSANFLPTSGTIGATLVLGSPYATATVDFQNPINLGNANRTVQVNQGSGTAAVDARLSGSLSGSGALVVIGDGTLALTGSNTYSGGTTVSDAVLSAQNNSALGKGGVTLSGGTLQLTTALGVSPSVTLTDDSAIDVTSGTVYLGAVSGSFGMLAKLGSGTLILSSVDSYRGGTAVEGGKLVIANSAALVPGTELLVGARATTLFGAAIAMTPASPTAAPVPEPGTLLLLSAAVFTAAMIGFSRNRTVRPWPCRHRTIRLTMEET